ncbi:hypothetical protein Tco_1143042, partial [Tanacetum coccineum]
MNLDDYEEPRVLVTCRSRLGRQMELLGDETDIVPLYYHIVDNFQIQFGREEFCLVIGLRFGVEYWAEYNNEDDLIPFRRRVFSLAKDDVDIGVGRLPTERLTPDENEARSDWWASSRAYFDGRISEAERVPRHVRILQESQEKSQKPEKNELETERVHKSR